MRRYLQLTIAQIGVGSSISLGKHLMMQDNPVSKVTQMEFRFIFCFLCLAFFMTMQTFSKNKYTEKYPSLDNIARVYIFLQSLCAGVLFNGLMLLGMQYTTATMTGIISSALPIIVAILSFLILKEKLTRPKALAILLTMIGMVVLQLDTLGTEHAANVLLGGSLILLSLVPEALYTIFVKLLGKRMHPLKQAAIINLVSVLVFTPFWVISGGISELSSLSINDWGLLAIIGILSAAFYYFWTAAVERVEANTAAIFIGVMPIATTVSAILILDEKFSGFDALGMGIVFVALVIGSEIIKKSKNKKNFK